jgi:hypothetical protein
MPEFPNWIPHEYMEQYFLGGSQYICDPPPASNTDIDWFILVKQGCWEDIEGIILQEDYLRANNYSRPFVSFKQIPTIGRALTLSMPVNLVLTTQAVWYEKMKLSTDVCKRLNLLEKEDRKLVFHAIVFGEDITAEREMRGE